MLQVALDAQRRFYRRADFPIDLHRVLREALVLAPGADRKAVRRGALHCVKNFALDSWQVRRYAEAEREVLQAEKERAAIHRG